MPVANTISGDAHRRSYRAVTRQSGEHQVALPNVMSALVGCVVPRGQIGRDAAPLAHRDALGAGPLADLSRATRTCRGALAATRPAAPPAFPRRTDKRGKSVAERGRVLGADVNFVRRPIHRKGNGFIGRRLVIVDIADKENLYALGHANSPSTH